MKEKELISQINLLEGKVNQLVGAYIQSKERIYYLEKENNKLQNSVQLLEEEVEELNKLHNNMVKEEAEKQENHSLEQVKKEINSYIKLIDKCIEHLDS